MIQGQSISKWVIKRNHENLPCIHYELLLQIAHLPDGGVMTPSTGESKDSVRSAVVRMKDARIIIPRSPKGAYSLTEYGLVLFKKAKPLQW